MNEQAEESGGRTIRQEGIGAVFCAPHRGFLVAAGVALTASAARAETYTSLMVFGDSLSDVGNEHRRAWRRDATLL